MSRSKKLPSSRPRRSRLLDATTARGAEVDPSSAPEKPGLASRVVQGLFGKSSESNSQSDAASSNDSATSPIVSSLSAEAEAGLSRVADVVEATEPVVSGAEAPEGESGDAVNPELSNQQRIDALVALGYVDANDGGDLAECLFDWLAEKLGDHWKLNAKRREKIGRPLAAIINSCAEAVFDNLPEGVGGAVSEHPEWTALGIAVAGTVVPCALKQLKARRKTKTADGGEVIAPDRKPARSMDVKPGSGSIPVPTATGTFGGR
jgi:hypothetical protein